MGTDKRSAAEFSFFLAMPTMAGAFVYDLYKNYDVLSMDDMKFIVVGICNGIYCGNIGGACPSRFHLTPRLFNFRMVADGRGFSRSNLAVYEIME